MNISIIHKLNFLHFDLMVIDHVHLSALQYGSLVAVSNCDAVASPLASVFDLTGSTFKVAPILYMQHKVRLSK